MTARRVAATFLACGVLGSATAGCAQADSAGSPPAAVEPLTNYLLSGSMGIDDATQAVLDESIVRCMAEQGFSYTGGTEPSTGESDRGLVIARSYFSDNFVSAAVSGSPEGVDPNVEEEPSADEAYFEALSVANQDAYLEALEGDQGCEAMALDQFGFGFMNESSDSSALSSIFDDVGHLPAVVERSDAVQRCLSETGTSFEDYGAVVHHLNTRIEQIVSTGLEGTPPAVTLSASGLAALQDLQQEEAELEGLLRGCGALPEQVPDNVRAAIVDYLQDQG